jgi:hypothetical protein
MITSASTQSGNSYVPHPRAILQRYGYPPRPLRRNHVALVLGGYLGVTLVTPLVPLSLGKR